MNSDGFVDFYRAVHGRNPFPWQEQLSERVLSDGWPNAISIPTGCGKTSVLDVAVFALAMQAGAADRTAPMRIFFVVDRRLVVDDVLGHAKKLVDALAGNRLDRVATSLRSFGNSAPLQAVAMRGGMYRNDTWADAPNQPLICVSTVDQVGSRLLFRGYGIRPGRRPIHAGLIGADSLVIVDEAHISQPFLQTLEAVQRYQSESWCKAPVSRMQFVRMSATLGSGFSLGEEDFRCDELKRRLEAKKRADLKEVKDLSRAAADEALKLAEPGMVIGVVLNTVRSARAAYEMLRQHGEAILLTGRSRPFERDEVIEEYKHRIEAGRQGAAEGLFVVATQTVEVGADIDFDALVTQSAPLCSLRQRFGRLDRLGRRGSSCAAILRPQGKDLDPVYGEPERRTWEWLKGLAQPIDFGVLQLANAPDALNGAPEEAPLMFPAHVETWAQTNPTPGVDPDVGPFLHGYGNSGAADVQIVWRADLPDETDDWPTVLEEAPPTSAEALPVPFRTALAWLKGTSLAEVADLESTPSSDEGAAGDDARHHLIWEGPDERRRLGLRPGDTIVLRSEEGGCDRFGWNPESKIPVRDIGDECANARADAGGGKFRRRIHPVVLFPQPEQSELRQEVSGLLTQLAADEDKVIELKEFVGRHIKGAEAFDWRTARPYGAGDALLLRWAARRETHTAEFDESDERDESSFSRPRSLDVHTAGVVEKVDSYLNGCGLSGPVALAIRRAAELHDIGKCDGRFQLMLGNSGKEPLAKGGGRRGQRGTYPKGARHEFASVRIAEAGAEWPAGCDKDLALYLIGVHHGYGRPFPPVWSEDGYSIRACLEGREVIVSGVAGIAAIDSGWLERYSVLNRRYGWWGLAYLEAILRRADCVRSREEESEAL